MSMNICLLSQEYPPDTGWGGIGTYTRNLARGLTMMGHRVAVIARALHEEATVDEGGVQIHRVLPRSVPGIAHALSRLQMGLIAERPLGWAFAAYRKFCEISRVIPLDVVEAPEHNADAFPHTWWKPLPLVVKLHIPMILHMMLNGHDHRRFRWRAFDWLERWTAHRADALSSPCVAMAEWVAVNWKLGRQRITVIPNPVDHEDFTPPANRGRSRQLILYVGRLERRKGVEILVDAFQRLAHRWPAAQLWLVGDGDAPGVDGLRNSSGAIANTAVHDGTVRKRIVRLGRLPRETLIRYYREAAVCVVPPPSFDNFPYTCLEAMACGAPVVASRTGGLPEMIVDGVSGLLVPRNDVDALSHGIERLLASPDLAESLGGQARRRVERIYSLNAVAQRTCELYERVLWARRRRHARPGPALG